MRLSNILVFVIIFLVPISVLAQPVGVSYERLMLWHISYINQLVNIGETYRNLGGWCGMDEPVGMIEGLIAWNDNIAKYGDNYVITVRLNGTTVQSMASGFIDPKYPERFYFESVIWDMGIQENKWLPIIHEHIIHMVDESQTRGATELWAFPVENTWIYSYVNLVTNGNKEESGYFHTTIREISQIEIINGSTFSYESITYPAPEAEVILPDNAQKLRENVYVVYR